MKSDVQYVRRVLQSSEQDQGVTAINYLWAAIVLVGFSLYDFAPGHVAVLYWYVVWPLGMVISAFLRRRASERRGQVRLVDGLRYNLFWGGTMVALVAASSLGATGVISPPAAGRVTLLILALTHFLGGALGDWRMLWIGILMMAGFVALFFVHSYVWTTIGVLYAASTTILTLVQQRKNVSSTN